MSIRLKLILTLSAVLVIAFSATSVISFVVSRQVYRASATAELLPLLTNNILLEIQRDLMMPIDISSVMANDTFLRDWVLGGEQDLSRITNYLSRIKNKYGFFSTFFVSDTSSNYYYYDGILKTISQDDAHDVWYYTFKESGVDVDLDVDADEASGGALTIFINHRVVDDDETLLGVTGVGLSMSGISGLLAEYQTRYGRLIYMVDADGLVQAHPDVTLAESMSIRSTEGIRSVADTILAQRGEMSFDFDRAGHHVFAEARFFPEFEWYLIAEQEADASMGQIRSALLSNLFIGLLATGLVILIVVFVVNRFQGQLEALVSIDPLTGIANRRHLVETLQTEVDRSRRYKHDLSLLMIDVDHFKRINDQYGHLAGDRLLVRLAKRIEIELRESDTLGRVGGDEFGAILPMTGLSDAAQLAERIRKSVSQLDLRTSTAGSDVLVTISVGVASVRPEMAGPETLYHLADVALYQAKEEGRDCVRTDSSDA